VVVASCVTLHADVSQPLPRSGDSVPGRAQRAPGRTRSLTEPKQRGCKPVGRPIAPPYRDHALFRMQNR